LSSLGMNSTNSWLRTISCAINILRY